MAQGMAYEDVRARVKRIANTKNADPRKQSNLINSLLNQAAIRSGEGARREIEKELRRK